MTAEDPASSPTMSNNTTPSKSCKPSGAPHHPAHGQINIPEGVAGAANEAALVALMERTGYSMVQENGQRKYGPPPGWTGPSPPRGCEIFVGKIPRDVYEDELVPVFESVGRIYEMRLMMDFDGKNRGYAFVMYTEKHEAKRAVRELNNYEVRPGRLLGVCSSVDNCRLFIGGIPKTKKREEILEEVSKVTEGVLDVIVYASAADKMKNRGFAFVEYESHRAAAMARRKLMPGRIQLWGHQIAVDWAEPEVDVDEDVMETVKILYVRNLMMETSEETIRQVFSQWNPGCVERVKKIRDYAFVHFTSREDAVLAMDHLNGTEIEGSCIEVTLAKPVDKEQYSRQKASKGGVSATSESTQQNYVYQCDPYTLAYYGYPYNTLIGPNRDYFVKGFSMIQNNAGTTRGRGRAVAGNRTPGPRGSYLGGYSAGRGIYSRYHEGKTKQPEKSYELMPSLELAASVNPVGIKPGTMALPTLATQYPVFSPTPTAKLMEEGKVHSVEHLINPLAMQHSEHNNPTAAAATAAAAAAAAATVLPAVSTPPPFQGRPITPVYAMAHNVQRIPAGSGLYSSAYIPITNYAANTAALATLHKNAAVAAAAYGGYAGYAVPQAFPAAAFQLPIHDVYPTVMEPVGDVIIGENLAEDKAAQQTPASSVVSAPRRALRDRGAGRSRSGVSAAVTDINGAGSSPQTSGRVLRDRSTRAVPAWLKDTKSDDEDELIPDTGATKRRKVSNSRRKKFSESAGSSEAGGEVTGDAFQGADSEEPQQPATNAQALPPRGPSTQTRAKPPSGRTVRSSAKPVCKTEPGIENPSEEKDEVKVDKITQIEQKEEEGEEVAEAVLDDEDRPFQDDPNNFNYQAQSQSGMEEEEEEECLSSDEDVPFRDDLNDQSYDPKAERDAPKPKRRTPPKQKEKKEKDSPPKKELEVPEIKVEGSDSFESVPEEAKVEEEVVEDPDGPRKRGRRKKDDKTPRLPKRRKKPPVQYVRCEIEGCGTVLAHPRYLQHHIKYQHLLKKKYVCPHPSCGRLFRLQKQLLRHAKHHTDQRDYICEFCARAFKSSHNLAVHRMIHTGEKPLQCEICGFTCRQKASLNWHMKKHDADATYQFSCSICGKKFEKKDCVVAHKAKSHPEVLIAEAMAANAGGLITTPASLLELPGNPVQAETNTNLEVSQVGQDSRADQVGQDGQPAAQVSQMGHVAQQMSHQVVLLGQDQSLHAMQVPVTIALSPIDPPSPAENQQQTHLQLQMPVQFVQTAQQPQVQQLTLHSSSVVTQHQPQLQPLHSYSSPQQNQGQTQILQMTFQPVSQPQTHIQQIPILATSQHLQTLQTTTATSPALQPQHQAPSSTDGDGFILDNSVLSSSSPPAGSLHQTEVVGDDVIWEQTGHTEVLSDGTERQVQQALM
ncbi:uncharacterized protein zfp91 [Pholidichthys leucotaenia]